MHSVAQGPKKTFQICPVFRYFLIFSQKREPNLGGGGIKF